MTEDPPFKGWSWDKCTFAPMGCHCDSCLGTNRVRWLALPIVWTKYGGVRPPDSDYRWVYLCDYCTYPDGGALTRISVDGAFAIMRSSTHGIPRIIVHVPRTVWPQ